MNIIVSVCISTFNHVDFIKECLDNILKQKTDFPFEIIIGEDESSDGTREICKEYAEKHRDKIRLFLRDRKDVIYIKEKATGRFNFIENLKSARGKYIAFCEGDDYWTDPYKLQKQVDFLEANPDYSGSSHWVDIIYEDSDKVNKEKFRHKGDISIDEIIKQRWITIQTGSFMFRSEYVNDSFLTTLLNYKGGSGDSILFAYLTSKGKINSIEEVMSIYRKHDGGRTRLSEKKFSKKEQFKVRIKTYKGLIYLLQAIDEIYNFEKSKMINKYILGLRIDILLAKLNIPVGNKVSRLFKKLIGI